MNSIYRQARENIIETGLWIKAERLLWELSDLKIKADTSLVTSLDLGCELRLKEAFSKLLTSSDFMAEETANSLPDAEWIWIIDPIDGTTNFVHGLPMYCISVALYRNMRPVFGCIYEISSGECFYADETTEGAFLNERKMSVSKAASLSQSLLATGFPTVDFSTIDPYLEVLKRLMQRCRGIRRLGTAAMDLAYVACGRCDGFYEYGLNAWDIAAGAYLVQKAGGTITDFEGGNNYLLGREILGTNGIFHREFLDIFKETT